MISLAAYAINQGHKVSGSDRSHDNGQFPDKFDTLTKMGATLYPQDGSGITDEITHFITSTAVEPTIPDVKAAMEQGTETLTRAEYLAQLINNNHGISIAGTSGKSSVTAMAAHIFHTLGEEPNVINGAVMLGNYGDAQLGIGNTLVGNSDTFIAESCESDGSITGYRAKIALLHNVTLDHKEMDELRKLFDTYTKNTAGTLLLNADDPECMVYADNCDDLFTYGLESDADLLATNIRPTKDGVSFDVHLDEESESCTLKVSGRHNVSNALAAISCAIVYGLSFEKATRSLKTFVGIKSRLENIGKMKNGATVIDDYAHNPDKIAASLQTLHEQDGRLIVLYQPHGFGPTKMLRDGYVETFSKNMKSEDILILSEIFYAGGTADKSISSQDLVDAIKPAHNQTNYTSNIQDARNIILESATSADRIVIMGARDDSLREFANELCHE